MINEWGQNPTTQKMGGVRWEYPPLLQIQLILKNSKKFQKKLEKLFFHKLLRKF